MGKNDKFNILYKWIEGKLYIRIYDVYDIIYRAAKEMTNRVSGMSISIVRECISDLSDKKEPDYLSYDEMMAIKKEDLRTELSGLILEAFQKKLKEISADIFSRREEEIQRERVEAEINEAMRKEAELVASETKRRNEVSKTAEKFMFNNKTVELYINYSKNCLQTKEKTLTYSEFLFRWAEEFVSTREKYLKEGKL